MSGDGESSEKCREARRRRIEMRRLSSVVGESATLPANSIELAKKRESEASDSVTAEKRRRAAASDPPLSLSPPPAGGGGGGKEVSSIASGSGSYPLENLPLGFGSVALSGRSRGMEDTVSVRPWFFRPDGGSPLHFFAVFDGHGGSYVSELCKTWMHVLMAEELTRVPVAATGEMEEEALSAAVKRCFGRMDKLALAACLCGRVGTHPCVCGRTGFASEFVGSTAVVAVVSPGRILVANCGDSRAVLSRGGRAVPMSDDQKPDRPDELARIEASGGRVIYLNGARVDGILAMSRALGDKFLKPVVLSEPEICVVDRQPQDECLIIASDGLWDVLSNSMACDVAKRCLEEGNPQSWTEDPSGEGQEHPQVRCNTAAALLARLALGRKSADNISVIVIDLRSG